MKQVGANGVINAQGNLLGASYANESGGALNFELIPSYATQ